MTGARRAAPVIPSAVEGSAPLVRGERPQLTNSPTHQLTNSLLSQHDHLRVVRREGAEPRDQAGDRLGRLDSSRALEVPRETKHVALLAVLRPVDAERTGCAHALRQLGAPPGGNREQVF